MLVNSKSLKELICQTCWSFSSPQPQGKENKGKGGGRKGEQGGRRREERRTRGKEEGGVTWNNFFTFFTVAFI